MNEAAPPAALLSEGGTAPAFAAGSGAGMPQLDLTFAADAAGTSRLVRRRVRYPYAFLRPFWFGDRPEGIATAILQSGSGGLFGGERLGQRVAVEEGAALHITTQAAAIVHARRGRSAAEQHIALHLAPGSYLEYLPEPMLMFPDGGLEQRIAVEMAADAVLLLGDGIAAHDPEASEGTLPQPFGLHRNSLEVRLPDGRLLFADRGTVTGEGFAAALSGGERPRRACGWFAAVAPGLPERHADLQTGLQAALDDLSGPVDAAAGSLPGGAGAWCRIVAKGGDGLRAAQRACWSAARLTLTGAPPPRNRK